MSDMQSLHNEKIYQLRYLVMPGYIIRDDRLSPTAIKVYCFIHTYTGKNFFFGNEHLAKMLNCSESAITRGLTQLKELQYIATYFDGRRRFVRDLYNRVGENADSESSYTPTLNEAEASADTPTLNEAILTTPKENNIKENNINISITKNFTKELEESGEFKHADWLKAKKDRLANKGKRLGYTKNPEDQAPYRKNSGFTSPKPRKGVSAEEVR